jgi:hypothetical protein
LYRFLAITVLLDVRDIPQVGPLQSGRITSDAEGARDLATHRALLATEYMLNTSAHLRNRALPLKKVTQCVKDLLGMNSPHTCNIVRTSSVPMYWSGIGVMATKTFLRAIEQPDVGSRMNA